MMTTITRWVLAHKRIVSTFWILVTLVGIATVSQSTRSFSTQFSVPGREGFETNVAIGRLYRQGGQNAPLLAVVTLSRRNPLARRRRAGRVAKRGREAPTLRCPAYGSPPLPRPAIARLCPPTVARHSCSPTRSRIRRHSAPTRARRRRRPLPCPASRSPARSSM